MNNAGIEELKYYFQEKITCLKTMEKLGKEQVRALESDAMEKLYALLQEKEALTVKIDGIDRAIDPLFKQLTPRDKSALTPLVQTIRSILTRLISLEKKSTRLVQQGKALIQNHIHQSRQNSRALKGYGKSQTLPTSRFLDLKNG